jgi:Caspase domain
MIPRDDIDFPRSRAILIGTSRYTAGFGSARMPGAANSLAAMRATLAGPCGWPESRIKTFPDKGNRDAVLQQIAPLIHETSDVLLFYYVGHGQLLPGNDLGLALTDTSEDPRLRKSTSLRLGLLREEIGDCDARIKIVILDCCCSGIANKSSQGPGDLAARVHHAAHLEEVEGAYTWTACGHSQDTFFEPGEDGLTYFTKFLAETARDGIAGRAAGLTLADFNQEVKRRLRQTDMPGVAIKPVPTFAYHGPKDAFVFARNAAPPETHVDFEVLYRRLLGEKPAAQSEDSLPAVPTVGSVTGGLPGDAGAPKAPVAAVVLSAPTERVPSPIPVTPKARRGRGRALAGVLAVLVLVAAGFAAKEWVGSRAGLASGWARLSVPADILQIGGVSCPTPGFCMVVGGLYVRTLSHGVWQSARKVGSEPFGLGPISCVSDSFCVAGGGITAEAVGRAQVDVSRVYAYSGGTWSLAQLTGPEDGRPSGMSISCVTTDFCMAVGGVDAYTYSGGHWSVGVNVGGHASNGIDTAVDDKLVAVSCASRDWCLAVGGSDTMYTYSDGVWAPAPGLAPPGSSEITVLSCASPSFCAVSSIEGFGVGILSDGHWSTYPTYANPVSCPAVGFCVGLLAGDAYTYTDGRWSDTAVYSAEIPDYFQYLSCASTRYCLATTLDGDAYVYSLPPATNSRSSSASPSGRTP